MPDFSKVKKPRPASTMLARRRASAKYREKNEDELRDKARERMAKHRQRIREEPDVLDEAQGRARQASQRYREKHASSVAHRLAFEKKHGAKAWLERSQKLEAQRREAQEEKEWQEYALELKRRERDREAAETLGSLAAL
ncbi:hypothetical protein B0H11DRAFT_1940822 [Mycena galericulata]|nr:hypothetical protein B0H11DRAFT_1940822 [Mycena galericulata]